MEYQLCIKSNNAGAHTPCGICRVDFRPFIGPVISLQDGVVPVCEDCARKIDPALFKQWSERLPGAIARGEMNWL
jgi:hypothetical protein